MDYSDECTLPMAGVRVPPRVERPAKVHSDSIPRVAARLDSLQETPQAKNVTTNCGGDCPLTLSDSLSAFACNKSVSSFGPRQEGRISHPVTWQMRCLSWRAERRYALVARVRTTSLFVFALAQWAPDQGFLQPAPRPSPRSGLDGQTDRDTRTPVHMPHSRLPACALGSLEPLHLMGEAACCGVGRGPIPLPSSPLFDATVQHRPTFSRTHV